MPQSTAQQTARPHHLLQPLPYDIDALAPLISRETLEYHHGKHHRAYVNNLNTLVVGTNFEKMALADIVRSATGPIFNNAAQVWNHDFYWNCLGPKGGSVPTGELARLLDSSFSSFNDFASQFKASAATKFGSGWTWLVKGIDGRLAIVNSNDADTPLRSGHTPLLVCDVWEHAYYIDYRNERARYIEAFWKLVNWDFVAGRLTLG